VGDGLELVEAELLGGAMLRDGLVVAAPTLAEPCCALLAGVAEQADATPVATTRTNAASGFPVTRPSLIPAS
jgi:hypothetical protein